MEGYIAEIRMFAGNFEPKNWAYCAGQTLAIQTNQALFSLIGTYFGGTGTTTFMLPDLRGRTAVGVGTGPSLPSIVLGQSAGTPTAALTQTNLPLHNHTATATVAPKIGTGKVALVSDPTNNFPGQTPPSTPIYTATSTTGSAMGPSPVNVQISNAGSGLPFSLMQPYLGMNYVICLYGIYPSRN